jgi:hypothetical protein
MGMEESPELARCGVKMRRSWGGGGIDGEEGKDLGVWEGLVNVWGHVCVCVCLKWCGREWAGVDGHQSSDGAGWYSREGIVN